MDKTKVVIFDFDGVITDTFAFCYEIHNTAHPLSEEDYRAKFEGNINDALKKTQKPASNFWDLYTPQLLECKPNLGIEEIIKILSGKYSLVIVSSTTSSTIKSFLEKFNLDKYFKEVLGNDIDHSKVKKLQMVLDKYNISPSDTIFITDTLGDIKEARRCGIGSIAVTWGYHPIETLQKGNPYKIVNSINELIEKIETYLK
jgi:phosphoglycolate phosphatase